MAAAAAQAQPSGESKRKSVQFAEEKKIVVFAVLTAMRKTPPLAPTRKRAVAAVAPLAINAPLTPRESIKQYQSQHEWKQIMQYRQAIFSLCFARDADLLLAYILAAVYTRNFKEGEDAFSCFEQLVENDGFGPGRIQTYQEFARAVILFHRALDAATTAAIVRPREDRKGLERQRFEVKPADAKTLELSETHLVKALGNALNGECKSSIFRVAAKLHLRCVEKVMGTTCMIANGKGELKEQYKKRRREEAQQRGSREEPAVERATKKHKSSQYLCGLSNALSALLEP